MASPRLISGSLDYLSTRFEILSRESLSTPCSFAVPQAIYFPYRRGPTASHTMRRGALQPFHGRGYLGSESSPAVTSIFGIEIKVQPYVHMHADVGHRAVVGVCRATMLSANKFQLTPWCPIGALKGGGTAQLIPAKEHFLTSGQKKQPARVGHYRQDVVPYAC